MLANIIKRLTINTSGTNQPSTKQHIFTKVPVKCLCMLRFSKLRFLQKAVKFLNNSWLGLPALNTDVAS